MNKVINYSMYANLPYRQEDVMDLKGRDFLTLKDYTPEELSLIHISEPTRPY